MIPKIVKRFEELEAARALVMASKFKVIAGARIPEYEKYRDDVFLNWCVKVRNLLQTACGPNSVHMQAFTTAEASPKGNMYNFQTCTAVFRAAKDDYEGGYLAKVESLVRAQVFDSALEQAQELYANGYYAPAAVVAGTVLETTIRGMCDAHGIPNGKVDKMNADLAKAGIYNALVQKQVTTMAHVRNKAAHGQTAEYTAADVEAMIKDVERFASSMLEA